MIFKGIDSNKKSVLKSVVWRILGIIILAIITYIYTQQWVQTTLITVIHHLAFIIIFYLHERAWIRVRSKWRHIWKAITYEIILGNVVLGFVSWLITGSFLKASTITFTYIPIKLAVYPVYDYFWSQKVVYAYVCGDILHLGHLRHLLKAKKYGYLIVGVLTDGAVMEKKSRPIIPFEERLEMVRLLKPVDEVIPQETYSPLSNIKKIKPDVLIESESHKEMPANDYVKSYGGKVVINPYWKPQSSSKIKAKMEVL